MSSLDAEKGDVLSLGIHPPRRMYAIVLMVTSAVVMSFGGLIMRSIDQADPWQINFYRALALSAAIALIILFRYRRNAIARVRHIGQAGLLGGVLLAAAGITYLQALSNTTVANTLFTLSAIPFITAVLARVFLKEGLQRATLVTMLVAAIGIFVMVGDGIGIGDAYGNAMALATAICFSGFAVIVRRNRHVDMVATVLVSGVIIALVALATRIDDLGITLHDLLLCLLWGGVLSGYANWMFIIASRHLVAAELTLFMLLEFSLGPLWVWLVVAEVPREWTLIGGALVILAVTVRATIELRRARPTLRRGRPSLT